MVCRCAAGRNFCIPARQGADDRRADSRMEGHGGKNTSFSAQDDIGYTYSVKGGVSDYRDGSGRFEERSATLAEMIKGSDEFLAGYGMERRGGIYRAFGTCEKRVAVFCHGGFGAAWIGHLLGMAPLRAFRQLDITTTGVTVFDFIPEADGFVTPRMVAFSGAAHLYNAGLRQKP